MKISYDLHTHTIYSHGKGSIEDNASAAKEKGLLGIGITDHGFSHPAFGMRRRKLSDMRFHCDNAEKLTGLKVLLGIESNILGESGKIDVKEKDYDKLDLILAGVHKFVLYDKLKDYYKLFFKNACNDFFNFKPSESVIKYNTKTYIKAIENNPIDVITHVGYCCPCDAAEVAKCARDNGTYIEINTKKTHLSDDEWRAVIDTGVEFVIDSDAHSVDRIGDDRLAEELFKRVEFPTDRIMNIDGRMPKLRFEEFKKRG